jgi:ATP-dependent DNA helicase PIF1
VVAQIPLCLAWALTIHKIQGATLEMADMDLGKSVYEYGQVYVALSRIRSLNGLYISEFYPHRVKANPIVKQFYSSLLTDYEDVSDTNISDINVNQANDIQTENIFEKFANPDPTIKRIKY